MQQSPPQTPASTTPSHHPPPHHYTSKPSSPLHRNSSSSGEAQPSRRKKEYPPLPTSAAAPRPHQRSPANIPRSHRSTTPLPPPSSRQSPPAHGIPRGRCGRKLPPCSGHHQQASPPGRSGTTVPSASLYSRRHRLTPVTLDPFEAHTRCFSPLNSPPLNESLGFIPPVSNTEKTLPSAPRESSCAAIPHADSYYDDQFVVHKTTNNSSSSSSNSSSSSSSGGSSSSNSCSDQFMCSTCGGRSSSLASLNSCFLASPEAGESASAPPMFSDSEANNVCLEDPPPYTYKTCSAPAAGACSSNNASQSAYPLGYLRNSNNSDDSSDNLDDNNNNAMFAGDPKNPTGFQSLSSQQNTQSSTNLDSCYTADLLSNCSDNNSDTVSHKLLLVKRLSLFY